MKQQKKQILLSNDDGIDSPGLWAAAETLSELGFVTVSAPRDHMSATGRGHQKGADRRATKQKLNIKGQDWDVYAFGGSPSQCVSYGILELAPKKPDLVVSGINFGENFGTDLTYSGTVGAALEAASLGIPGLAVSQQLSDEAWNHYQKGVDFSISAYFTKYFADILLKSELPHDVDVLNIVVPEGATKDTPWKVTKLARTRYFKPFLHTMKEPVKKVDIRAMKLSLDEIPPDSDMHTVLIDKQIAVVPVSLDLTSRVESGELENILRK